MGGGHFGMDIYGNLFSTQGYGEADAILGYDVYDRCATIQGSCFRFRPIIGLGGGFYTDSQVSFFQAYTGPGIQWVFRNRFTLGVEAGLGIKVSNISTVNEQISSGISSEFQQKRSDRVLAIGWIQPFIEVALHQPEKGPTVSLRFGCRLQNGPAPLTYSYGSLDFSCLVGFRVRIGK